MEKTLNFFKATIGEKVMDIRRNLTCQMVRKRPINHLHPSADLYSFASLVSIASKNESAISRFFELANSLL